MIERDNGIRSKDDEVEKSQRIESFGSIEVAVVS